MLHAIKDDQCHKPFQGRLVAVQPLAV